ncbi:MAG: tRNA lysidine(34) synthetase TilS [Planctomycetota bacterium]
MLRALSQELLDERLLHRDDAAVVGVSGGADSMALLHLLVGLNEKMAWRLRLHVAHLNHRLRGGESDKDAAFVQAAADGLSLPCTVAERDVANLAEAEAKGVEEFSRRERYAFFERVCLQCDARIVAVAHHADDNAETILHRILRGTGLRGLAGIPRSRPLSPGSGVRLIRPLLTMTRDALRKYLSDEGVAFREDRTNAQNEPMRNRLRNTILPMLESQVNPQVREALIRLAAQARWFEDFLQETVQRTLETLIISRTDQFLSLNVNALAKKSRIVQTGLIRQAYASFGLGEQDLAFSHLVAALDLIADPASGKQLQLPGGMCVEKRYHQLIFSLPTSEPREDVAPQIAVHLPGRTLLPIRSLEIRCTIEQVGPEKIPALRHDGGPLKEHVDFDAVHPPLVVRPRRPGERFFTLGAPGSKKLSDFLTGEKVDPRERRNVAVLCDQLGPIWVIGYRIDDRVKLTTQTRRVLHLEARPLDH